MPPLPVINAKLLIDFLESRGFYFVRQKGSHKRFKNNYGQSITVPDHGKTDLQRGLLNGILKELNISVDELINFLDKN